MNTPQTPLDIDDAQARILKAHIERLQHRQAKKDECLEARAMAQSLDAIRAFANRSANPVGR